MSNESLTGALDALFDTLQKNSAEVRAADAVKRAQNIEERKQRHAANMAVAVPVDELLTAYFQRLQTAMAAVATKRPERFLVPAVKLDGNNMKCVNCHVVCTIVWGLERRHRGIKLNTGMRIRWEMPDEASGSPGRFVVWYPDYADDNDRRREFTMENARLLIDLINRHVVECGLV